jgi:hypothetical protein
MRVWADNNFAAKAFFFHRFFGEGIGSCGG